MNAHLINRAMSTATSTLFNRRPVSQMDEDQRKAVMTRLSGGGYGGHARGGGSPARVATARLRRMSDLETLRHQGQVGLDSDITPVDLMIGSGIEEAYAGLQKAKEEAKNPWVTGALAAAGIGMLALGVRGNRKMVAKAAADAARKNVDDVLEQMGRDAARFGDAGRAGYAAIDDAGRMILRETAPITAMPGRWVNAAGQRLRGDAPRIAGDRFIAQAPTPSRAATPASAGGDAFRRAAEQATGSRRGQFLDYARRADLEAVAPRIVRDPWTSTRATIGNLNLGNRKDQTMTASLQLISNAIRVITIPDEILISNAPRMAMTDEQRKAMFSRKSSGYGGATARGRRPQPANNPLSGTPANYAPIASRTGEPGRPVLEAHVPRSSSPDYLSRHADGPRPNPQNFERFDTAWQTYINANPRHRDSGVYSQINGLLGAIRSGNATPQQLGHLEQLVGISLQPFRPDAPGAWDSERVLQSTMLASALGVLQNANRLTHYEPFNRVSNNPGITFHSHLTNYEHDPYARYGSGTNFSMNRPAMPNLPVTRTTASGTTSQGLSDAPRTGPGRATPPAYATTSGPNNSITTDMNGNILSATRRNAPRPPPAAAGPTPRTDPSGRQYYGPRPEEPGYIDHRGWRRGAEPAQPSRPAPPGIIDRR